MQGHRDLRRDARHRTALPSHSRPFATGGIPRTTNQAFKCFMLVVVVYAVFNAQTLSSMLWHEQRASTASADPGS